MNKELKNKLDELLNDLTYEAEMYGDDQEERRLDNIYKARAQIIELFKQHPKWQKLDIRECTEEEKSEGYTSMYDGETPELFETVIVTDGKGIYMREWTEFDIGVGFEDIDAPCWWMPIPELPEGGK